MTALPWPRCGRARACCGWIRNCVQWSVPMASGSIYPVLEAIEEQATLLRLMTEMVADRQGLAASIGRENEPFGLPETSVLTSQYDASGAIARVGVLGPTRMDYPSNLAAARAVAKYLSHLLDADEARR